MVTSRISSSIIPILLNTLPVRAFLLQEESDGSSNTQYPEALRSVCNIKKIDVVTGITANDFSIHLLLCTLKSNENGCEAEITRIGHLCGRYFFASSANFLGARWDKDHAGYKQVPLRHPQ